MAITSSDFTVQAQILRTAVKTLFYDTYNQMGEGALAGPYAPQAFTFGPTAYLSVATLIPTGLPKNQMNWMGSVPQMQEWIDERKPSGAAKYDYTVSVLDWESTLEVDRNALRDDNLGLIRPLIEALAYEARDFINRRVWKFLDEAATNLCYDGKAFFADNHSEGDSGTIDNKLAGSGGDTLAHIQTDWATLRNTMMAFKNDRGVVMGIVPDTIVCPPALEGLMRQMMNAELTGGGDTNIWRGSARIIVCPYLTDANDWYALCTSRPVKPLVVVNRQDPEFTAMDAADSYSVFTKKKLMYGVDSRAEVGYGNFRFGCKVVNT